MKPFAAGAVALAMMTAGTSAQDAAYPPVLNDLPPGYEFADGNAIGTIGILLGQPRAEAEAALTKAYPELQARAREEILGLRDAGDNEAKFRYYVSDEVSGKNAGHSIYTILTYSTAVTGERVTNIDRDEKFNGDEPDANQLIADLTKKFGEPTDDSGADGMQGVAGFRQLHWAWRKGKLAEPAGERQNVCHSVLASHMYVHQNDRVDDREGCTALLEVSIYAGRRPDLAGELVLRFDDYLRSFDNSLATDKWLEGELAKVSASVSAAPAPAL